MVRIISRVVLFDPNSRKILLVRNEGADFWYPPGGGWQKNVEDIRSCAERELKEETGIEGVIQKLIYTQQFHESPGVIFLEWFWLAYPAGETSLSERHKDDHGIVSEARWFSEEEVANVKVFPQRLKSTFWSRIDAWPNEEDPFIGVS